MATKPTVYKAKLSVANVDAGNYADYQLTLTCHPSETEERLMMRVLAFALNASERLEFGNAISEQNEPDLRETSLAGDTELWIQVGNPDDRNIAKACGKARRVIVYCYNQQPRQWWERTAPKLARQRNLEVYLVEPGTAKELSRLADRSMNLQVIIQDGEASFHADSGGVSVPIERLA